MAKKSYEDRQYALTESEMQDLVLKARQGNGSAQLKLLDVFENFLSPYIKLLYTGKYSLQNYDMRRFLELFVKDGSLRFFLRRNKLNPAGFRQLNEVIRGIVVMVQRYCLAGETEVITSEGTFEIKDLVGKTVCILQGNSNGGWQDAKISSFGIQPLKKITLKRHRQTKVLYATAEHRWFVRSNGRKTRTTDELIPGNKLVSIFGHLPGNVKLSPYGVGAGIVFGDGYLPTSVGRPAEVDLWGEKNAHLLKWFPLSNTRAIFKEETNLFGIKVTGLPRSWKNGSPLVQDLSYQYGWLAGYFAADGSMSKQGSPSIISYEFWRIKMARDVAYRLGIPTLGISSAIQKNGFRPGAISYNLRFPVGAFNDDFFLIPGHLMRNKHRIRGFKKYNTIIPDWEVVSIEETDRVEEVYCATVDDAHSFTLGDNILSGNCELEDVEQTVKLAFLECCAIYLPKDSKAGGIVPFSGYVYNYFYYVLKKKVDTLLIDQLGRKTFPLLSEADFEDDVEDRPPGFMAPPTPSAEDLANRDEIDEFWVAGDTSHGAFQTLTPQERQLLRWRYVDGERSSDIARRITEHPNTTREHLARIRNKLKEYLLDQEE